MLFQLICFFLMIAGSFLLLDLSPTGFIRELADYSEGRKQISLKSRILKVRGKKKKRKREFWNIIQEVKLLMEYTGQGNNFSRLCVLAIIFGIIGFIISIGMDNVLMIPAMVTACVMLPFLYMKFQGIKAKQRMHEELETALSIITTGYIRCEDIVKAVEDNIGHIQMPIREVFHSFLMQCKYIDANLSLALENMKAQIDSDVFCEWVDTLIACQNDKNLKVTLSPIVEKFSDMRIVTAEMERLCYAPMKEYFTMVILLVSMLPLTFIFSKEMFYALTRTMPGKLSLAICLVTIVFSTEGVIRNSKPIEYKR